MCGARVLLFAAHLAPGAADAVFAQAAGYHSERIAPAGILGAWVCAMAKGRQRRDNFEDISSYSSKRAVRRNQKKKKRTGLKIFLGFLFTLFILVGGVLVYASTFMLGGLKTTTITQDKTELGITEQAQAQTEEAEGITNIALFGVDSRSDAGTFTGRSDAIMVLSIDNVHNKIKLTSILRDVRVYIGEECGYDTGYDKLNHAYAYGGPELAIKTINQNFGLDIEDYVTVNFAAMAEIVDAFGGVDIEVTEGEIAELNTNLAGLAAESPESLSGPAEPYTGEAGLAHLDGNQAVAYGRIRNIGNDNERAERQQEVLSALLGKISSISPLEYPGLISKLAPLCETSLSISDILGFAPIVVNGFEIERLSIPSDEEGYESGYGEGGGWMWFYDTEQAGAHIRQFIYEDRYVA